MKAIAIKAFSACDAVKFFDVVNPLMFLGDDYPSQFRKRPEWYFLDPVTGKPREVQVKIPDECELNQDLGDLIYFGGKVRYRTHEPETYLEYNGSILYIEYAIVYGIKRPADSCECNCTLDTKGTNVI